MHAGVPARRIGPPESLAPVLRFVLGQRATGVLNGYLDPVVDPAVRSPGTPLAANILIRVVQNVREHHTAYPCLWRFDFPAAFDDLAKPDRLTRT